MQVNSIYLRWGEVQTKVNEIWSCKTHSHGTGESADAKMAKLIYFCERREKLSVYV